MNTTNGEETEENPLYGKLGFDEWIIVPHEETWQATQTFVCHDDPMKGVKQVSDLTDTELRNLVVDLLREQEETTKKVDAAYNILAEVLP